MANKIQIVTNEKLINAKVLISIGFGSDNKTLEIVYRKSINSCYVYRECFNLKSTNKHKQTYCDSFIMKKEK
ncbi:MAG TPA: hypothetical protein VI815_02575 [Candidatus Nanoarchaeia archaeon]|nr:hypothetical protein [Candidatus Nanoarchaeia archaeon]